MQELRSDAGVLLSDAAAVLKQSHQRVTRVSVLDDNFNPLSGLVFTGESGYALDGQVSDDETRYVRRTCSLSFANPGGIWTPSGEDSPFYWTKMLRLERGVRVGGVDFYAPQGVFQIDAPEVSDNVLSLTGADRIDRATNSEFTEATSYAAGQRLGVVLRDLLESTGVGSAKWSVDDGTQVLGAVRAYEQGDERLQSIMTLAGSFSLDVFADGNGFMVIRPKRDPTTIPISWTFQAGVDATHVGISKRWSRDRFYNHVLVTNDTSDDSIPLIRSEASVTDPSNPLRVTGPMGDRLFKYVSGMITTQGQADAVAASLLWEHAIIEEEIRLDHVPNPMLEAGDAVMIIDPDTDTNDRYAISSLTTPLAGGTASLTMKKIRLLN